ncbi:MAG: hypothetical protein AAGL96_19520, partial [Pseudomonadota bacterium]
EVICNEPNGPYFERLDNTTMEIFAASEVLEEIDGPGGAPTGQTVTVRTGTIYGQPHFFGFDLIGLIANTAQATHVVECTSAGIAPGDTVTGGTSGATATVTQVWGDRIWMRDLGGAFQSGESLSSSGGTGTTTGASERAGHGDLWALNEDPARDSISWAAAPYARHDMLGNARVAVGAL